MGFKVLEVRVIPEYTFKATRWSKLVGDAGSTVGSRVELLIDRRGKDVITPVLNLCYEAKRVVSPRIW
jgi:hypothetical protein